MYLSIAADHQWVDCADMARFQGRIKELIENPEQLGEF
ncbi:2-oxo acid dehydrogenase subunit E2 [Mycoplasmopsis bovis]